MDLEAGNRTELQTAELPKISLDRLRDRLSGVETLDFSVLRPEPTDHLKLCKSDGAWFVKKSKDTPQGNAWQIGAEDSGLQLELTLPYKHGVTLILEICRTIPAQQKDTPVITNVNGDHEWGIEIDPHNLNFHRQSWYLAHYMLEKGKNLISLRLAPEAATEALLRSASVMRFDLQMQQQSNWCWAAVTTSLLDFFDPENALTQCQVVKECFSQADFEIEADCCQQSKDKDCNRTFKLVDALDSM